MSMCLRHWRKRKHPINPIIKRILVQTVSEGDESSKKGGQLCKAFFLFHFDLVEKSLELVGGHLIVYDYHFEEDSCTPCCPLAALHDCYTNGLTLIPPLDSLQREKTSFLGRFRTISPDVIKTLHIGAKKMVAPQRPSANYNPMNISLVQTKDTVYKFDIFYRKPTQKK